MNKQIVILTFSFVLIFTTGVYIGSAFKISDHSIVKRQKSKRVHVKNYPQYKPLMAKKPEKIEKSEDQKEIDYPDCYYDSDFDSQTFNELYEEESEKWDQTLKELFSERTAYPERMIEDFKKLKEAKELDHQEIWKKNSERTKINEHSYAYFPSWDDDKAHFEIDKKYHEDLSKLLGRKVYEKYQQKIKTQYEEQIKKARNGEPYVAGFDY